MISKQEGSITSLEIDNGGQNYIAGDISVTGGDGNNFSATFQTDQNGSINQTSIQNYGKKYSSSPTTVNVMFAGTSIPQVSFHTSLVLHALEKCLNFPESFNRAKPKV